MDWKLVERCLAGECSDEEKEALRRWLEENDDRRELFAALTEIWASAEKARPRYDSKVAWRNVRETITRPTVSAPARRPQE